MGKIIGKKNELNELDKISRLNDNTIVYGLGKFNPVKGDLSAEQAEVATKKIKKENLEKMLEEERLGFKKNKLINIAG